MHISWLGSTAFKIQARPFADDVVILLDPYKPEAGDAPRSLTAEVVLATRGEKNLMTLSGNPFLLATPGECETKGVLLMSTPSQTPGQNIIRIDTELLSVGHLGMASKPLTNAELEVVSGVDILFVPVGGDGCYDAEMAVKMVNEIEPRIIIPMAYRSDNNPKAADVSEFIKAIGLKAEPAETKVIIKKKDLPIEEMKLILLVKE